MPYRDTGDALESKLRFLLDARRELDASIAQTRRELEPYVAARRRSGVDTALRVAIVAVAVLSCFAAVAFAILPRGSCCSGCSRIDSTRTDARTLVGAVEMYLAENPGSTCATVDELVRGGFLNSATRTTDVWDGPFVIECDGTEITVTSAGPDGEHGSEDDIR